jgi:triacylglycerol esterase/lipase EstA (alpha/beta hydrolase family)
MNRVVHAHLKSLLPETPAPESPVFTGGSTRPNVVFRQLCRLAGIKPKSNFETGQEEPWVLKDLRKTCATYYDEHVPESSIEILGHSVGGVTYRHYAQSRAARVSGDSDTAAAQRVLSSPTRQ